MSFSGSFLRPVLVLCLSCVLILSEPIVDTDEDGEIEEVSQRSERDLKTLITEKVIEEVFKKSETILKARRDLETKLYNRGRVVKTSSRKTDPSLIRMKKTDPVVNQYEWHQMTFEEATSQLHKRFNLTRDEMGRVLRTIPLTGELSRRQKAMCTRDTSASVRCDRSTKYRTADGSCNNLQNPTWGRAMTCQKRLMDAYYVGNSGYRQSVDGELLPDPRLLSRNLHYDLNRPTNHVTHMFMYFGQLLDHDIALTPTSTTMENEAIQCCPVANETHPQCRPILPGPNDPFYSPENVTCLNFVRSAICATCNLGHKEVMNQLTSFVDASFVYGNSENETNSLRTNDGTGRLRVQKSSYGDDLLPQSPNPNDDQCSVPERNEICFEAGDSRVNQHPVLTTLQTLFLRVHNQVADELRRLNPYWDGNRIFQEARRIVIAMFQCIVYKEFLPITLGPDRMNYFKLWIGGGYTKYNSRLNPSLIPEFSTAAYRFGHSLINSIVSNNPLNATGQRRLLRDYFFEPFELYGGLTGPLLRGACNSPAQWFDRHLVPDVTNYLYRVRGDPTGLDLAAININRGRDHGLPPYVDAVRFCSDGRIVIQNFEDLMKYGLMEYEQMDALRNNYRSVFDVDMWPGILMEIPNEGAVVGPTAACFIGAQFKTWKYGDRFYFEHNNTPGKFTWQQLTEIRKITLSKLICLNTDVSQIAQNAMLFKSANNPVINCRQVRGVDLSYWREERSIFDKILG